MYKVYLFKLGAGCFTTSAVYCKYSVVFSGFEIYLKVSQNQLTHFMPLASLGTSRLQIFSGGIEREQWHDG